MGHLVTVGQIARMSDSERLAFELGELVEACVCESKAANDDELLEKLAAPDRLVDFVIANREAIANAILMASSRGVAAIATERLRQIEVEGWTPEHDDELHGKGGLAEAAAAYALHAALTDAERAAKGRKLPKFWPWHDSWWKPKDRRRDLERAGALIVAEIERLDRLAAKGGA